MVTTLTLRSQLRALAKSYGLQYSKLYNDFRVKHERFKFYNVNPSSESTRWFLLRLQNEYPHATVRMVTIPLFFRSLCHIIIAFKK